MGIYRLDLYSCNRFVYFRHKLGRCQRYVYRLSSRYGPEKYSWDHADFHLLRNARGHWRRYTRNVNALGRYAHNHVSRGSGRRWLHGGRVLDSTRRDVCHHPGGKFLLRIYQPVEYHVERDSRNFGRFVGGEYCSPHQFIKYSTCRPVRQRWYRNDGSISSASHL